MSAGYVEPLKSRGRAIPLLAVLSSWAILGVVLSAGCDTFEPEIVLIEVKTEREVTVETERIEYVEVTRDVVVEATRMVEIFITSTPGPATATPMPTPHA